MCGRENTSNYPHDALALMSHGLMACGYKSVSRMQSYVEQEKIDMKHVSVAHVQTSTSSFVLFADMIYRFGST